MATEASGITTMQSAFIRAGLLTQERAVIVNRIKRSQKLRKKPQRKGSKTDPKKEE